MSRIIEEMYETAKGLHTAGVIDKRRMREYEALHRASHVPQRTGEKSSKCCYGSNPAKNS